MLTHAWWGTVYQNVATTLEKFIMIRNSSGTIGNRCKFYLGLVALPATATETRSNKHATSC